MTYDFHVSELKFGGGGDASPSCAKLFSNCHLRQKHGVRLCLNMFSTIFGGKKEIKF